MTDEAPQDKTQQIVDQYYAQHYEAVHGSGRLGQASSVFHQRLERQRRASDHFSTTLEVGAGHFQHFPFVRHSFDTYLATDIRTPDDSRLYRELQAGTAAPGLEFKVMDALSLDLEDSSVDRLVASCLLIHLPDPMAAIREWQRVCKPDAVMDLLVPCDPGLLLRAFRRFVSHPTAAKHGVAASEYALVNAIEHVSPFSRVLTLTRAALEDHRRLEVDYYPFRRLPSWNLNAFAVLSIGPR